MQMLGQNQTISKTNLIYLTKTRRKKSLQTILIYMHYTFQLAWTVKLRKCPTQPENWPTKSMQKLTHSWHVFRESTKIIFLVPRKRISISTPHAQKNPITQIPQNHQETHSQQISFLLFFFFFERRHNHQRKTYKTVPNPSQSESESVSDSPI